MAKKQTINPDLFARTEPTEPEPERDLVKPRGIGLKESEWSRMDEIGAAMGSNAHALAAWAIRDFIKRYDTGDLPILTRKQTTLPGL